MGWGEEGVHLLYLLQDMTAGCGLLMKLEASFSV